MSTRNIDNEVMMSEGFIKLGLKLYIVYCGLK